MSIYINVLERIKKLKNFTKETELAEFLGESKQNLGNWYARSKYNLDEVLDRCRKDGLDVNYLLTGEKEEAGKEAIETLRWQMRYEELEKRYNLLEERTRATQAPVRADDQPGERRKMG